MGTGIAGMAAIGAGNRCLQEGRKFPFISMAFVGAPLTQTIYGFLLMNAILSLSKAHLAPDTDPSLLLYLMTGGVFGGMAIGVAGWMQGRAAAVAADAIADNEKGFVNYMMILGIIESVALFVMIFIIVTLNKLAT